MDPETVAVADEPWEKTLKIPVGDVSPPVNEERVTLLDFAHVKLTETVWSPQLIPDAGSIVHPVMGNVPVRVPLVKPPSTEGGMGL
jgi:hypothetical protein